MSQLNPWTMPMEYKKGWAEPTMDEEQSPDVPAAFIPGIDKVLPGINLNDLQKVRLVAIELAFSFHQQFRSDVTPAQLIATAKKFEEHILTWEQDALDRLKTQS